MPRKSYSENEKNIRSVRWEAILRIISERPISTQQELTDELCKQGYEVTQATVSRDIKDLKLVKTAMSSGGYRYKAGRDDRNAKAAEKFHALYKAASIRIDCAMNQVVIHCLNGMAGAVCAAMDSFGFDEIIGTIAGDDTILIITRSEKAALELMKKLNAIK